MHQHDYAEIERALSAFTTSGQVFELRLLRHSKRVDAGYFDSAANAASALAGINETYAGVYFTPNPVVRDVAARSFNRINPWSQFTTHDAEIAARRWILVDVDPTRPKGISSTDEELSNAFKVARRISNALELDGWPRPYLNQSGNGAHLLYPFNEQNTDFVRDEIAKFLKILAARFDGDGCKVDIVNYNAARIWRVPGTWARKGDSVPERPHRKAVIVQEPCRLTTQPVTLSQLCQFNSRNETALAKANVALTGRVTGQVNKGLPTDEKKYTSINQQAMNRLAEWVPEFFKDAREYQQGYRVSSDSLGLDYEEDLTIHPFPRGIKYFGIADQGDETEGRRTPVGIIAEFVTNGDKDEAARKLADCLKAPVTEFANISLDPVAATAKLPGIESTPQAFDFKRMPNMAQLQQRVFKDQKWVIKNVLPTGNILLAARPKMRKTFLALQLCLSIVGGAKFLDWDCDQGDVLFLGLEDNERRLRSRIALLQRFNLNPPDLTGFRYWTGGVDISPTTGKVTVVDPVAHERTYAAFPRGEGGVDALRRFLDTFPRTKLIVIDTYAHFREASNNRDVYQRDYDQMMPITRLAAEREVGILTVHHEKKGLAKENSGDFMEDVSGTSGITGAVDGVMSIKGIRGPQQDNEERKLLLSGRDIPKDWEVDMKFDAERGGWLPAARQDVRSEVVALLGRHPFISPRDMQHLLPTASASRISQVLANLQYEGIVRRGRYGWELVNTFKGD